MFTFSEMLALVESESSFVAYVCHRRPGGYRATSDLVDQVAPRFYRILIDRDGGNLTQKPEATATIAWWGLANDGGNGEYSLGQDENEISSRPVEGEGEEEEDGEEEEEGVVDQGEMQEEVRTRSGRVVLKEFET